MIELVCDNPEVRKPLEKLADLLVKEGAYFYPDLRAVYQDGNFSMHALKHVEEGQLVTHIPYECLINAGHFTFALENGAIVIDSMHENSSALSKEILPLVLDLYNKSGKLEQYEHSSVYALYYEDPELYELLTRFNTKAPPDFEALDKELLFLRQFLHSRVLKTYDQPGEEVVILPPFLEFFNHCNLAPTTHFSDGKDAGEQTLGMSAYGYMDTDSDEVFINYGVMEPYSLFMSHGFWDPNVKVIKSIPLEMELAGKTIMLYQRPESPRRGDLPKRLADLGGYCPYFDLNHEDVLGIGFLYIPDTNAPLSMRRILRFGFNMLLQDQDRALEMTRMAERRIIAENLDYYEELKWKLDHFKPSPEMEGFIHSAKEMAEFQLSLIRAYPFFDEAMEG